MQKVTSSGHAGRAGMGIGSTARTKGGVHVPITFFNVYDFWAYDPDGELKWHVREKNLVTNVGLNDLLSQYFKGAAYTAAWYVGLVSGTPTIAAGDTMASHGGWTEIVAYSESVRQTLTLGTVASQAVNNSASKATFSINANSTTMGGAFLNTVSTKSGTTGTLFGAAAFTTGNKTLDSGDTLAVQVNLSAASA